MKDLGAVISGEPPPFWLFFFPLAWIVVVILASAFYRRSVGKPILPTAPKDAIFVERRGSARFAANCLLVTVTKLRFSVVPRFPFNLMFLPEIYRLEYQVPLTRIRSVETQRSFLFRCNVIVVRDDSKKFRLRVQRPLALASVIRQAIN